MIERGDATAEDIDQAMELGAGYRESCLSGQKGANAIAMGVS